MSRTIKKALAAVVFAIVSLTGILCFAVINAAHAEGASPVKMLEGASVRYQMQEESDRSGIRFTAYVETEYKADNPEAVYGMLLIPSDLLGEGELTVGTASAVNKVVEVWTTSEEEGFDRFNVVLYNIPESEYGRVITARAYVKNGDVYTYSEESVSRSLGQVASLALADGDPAITAKTITFMPGMPQLRTNSRASRSRLPRSSAMSSSLGAAAWSRLSRAIPGPGSQWPSLALSAPAGTDQ